MIEKIDSKDVPALACLLAYRKLKKEGCPDAQQALAESAEVFSNAHQEIDRGLDRVKGKIFFDPFAIHTGYVDMHKDFLTMDIQMQQVLHEVRISISLLSSLHPADLVDDVARLSDFSRSNTYSEKHIVQALAEFYENTPEITVNSECYERLDIPAGKFDLKELAAGNFEIVYPKNTIGWSAEKLTAPSSRGRNFYDRMGGIYLSRVRKNLHDRYLAEDKGYAPGTFAVPCLG